MKHGDTEEKRMKWCEGRKERNKNDRHEKESTNGERSAVDDKENLFSLSGHDASS